MKKFLLVFCILVFGTIVFAGEQDDAMAFFNSVVNASNTYSPNLSSMYSDSAKIIRQVIKPDGTLVNVYFSGKDYKDEMKRNAKFAKLVGYKNYYSDTSVSKAANGYKINAMRRPSPSDYKLKTYMVVAKQPDGKWVVVEELMQTKVQTFLKYATK
ncbi:MAG: hypothetical protein PHC64_00645 [Candidatus Gastranaerophilales bacterium]|nr:hypothetical protein [Candidatus Gastranaerophilales bacterium]